jgi:hypothetical protein
MKLDKFNSHYKVTAIERNLYGKFTEVGDATLKNLSEVQMLIDQFGGATLDKGLFRIHNRGSFYYWTKLGFDYFKKYRGASYVFGFDWVGRHFAVTNKANKNIILMLDPATAEVFELEASIEDFFNIDLVEGKNDLLEEKRFQQLRKGISDDLAFDHCLGFIKPLFVGGKDENSNLDDSDMEIYWELNYQVYCKTKNLTDGTKLNFSI